MVPPYTLGDGTVACPGTWWQGKWVYPVLTGTHLETADDLQSFTRTLGQFVRGVGVMCLVRGV